MSQFSKKAQKPHAKALYVNKRDRLKQMVQESTMGHEWRYTRGETAANLQLKCAICELWIQQVHAQEVFHRIDSQPCKNFPNQGPQFWTALHPSHQWFSTGKTWECSGCGVSFGPAVAKEPSKASKTCSKAKVGIGKISFAKASPNRTEAQTCPRGKLRPLELRPQSLRLLPRPLHKDLRFRGAVCLRIL